MYRLENLQNFIRRQRIKGITYTSEKATQKPLTKEQLERNNVLFQLWNGYREPDSHYPPEEDMAAVLEEARFNIDVLSQQRVRAITEEEALEFRDRYKIPKNVRIKGDAFPHDGHGNSWMHAMDWSLAHDRANIIHRISRRPRGHIGFDKEMSRTDRYYSFSMNHTGGGGEKIWKQKFIGGGMQEALPEILPSDRDVLAAVYLIPDVGSEKGDTFWNKWSPFIARPSTVSNYSDYSFYGTWEDCGGGFHINNKYVEEMFEESKYDRYLHVFMLEQH